MKNTKELAKEYYSNFSELEGNQHIAGLFGLEKILDIVKSEKPKRILEIGLGIGSICYSILRFSSLCNIEMEYVGTEDNDFCLQELPKNLKDDYDRVTIFKNVDELSKTKKFDLIIIDGSDEALEAIKNIANERAIIFIEGGRASQVKQVKKIFPKYKYTSVVSPYKNPNYGPFSKDNWSGGGQVIYTNPNLSQELKFLKMRFETFFTYKIRRKLK